MKKILYITNIAKKRMAYSFSGSAIEAARDMEFEFFSVANRSQATEQDVLSDEEKYGVKLLHMDSARNPFSWRNFKAYRQLCKIIRENGIDCIHCNTPTGGLLGRLAGKKCKVKKVLYQAHGFHFYKGASFFNRTVLKWAEKIMARWTDAIITMNREDYEAAQKFKLRKGGKVYFVHGVGVPLHEFEGLEAQRFEKCQEIGVPEDAFLLLSVGELNTNKNHETVIRAVASLHNKNIHYAIAGTGSLNDSLMDLAKSLGVEEQIHLLGYRKDVAELYSISDIYVHPSFREGLPVALMEAMACGLPCIVSRIRGNVDLIAEGQGGYRCTPTDVNEFVAAIRALYENPEARELMSKNNLETIKEYDISVVRKEMREIYEEVFEK